MKYKLTIFIMFVCTCIAIPAAAQTQKTHLLKEDISAWRDSRLWQLAADATSDSANENLSRSITAWKKINVILNSE